MVRACGGATRWPGGVSIERERPGSSLRGAPCSNALSLIASAYAPAEATFVLAFCNMKTLYLRSVPDEVAERLERLARAEGISVSAAAIRELAEATRRADNPALLGALPDLGIGAASLVADLDAEREVR
jgi:hypothetical protein